MVKKILLSCLCIFLSAAGCLAADLVEGFWISWDDKTGLQTAGWEIYVQNNVLYGKILSLYGKPQTEIAVKCKESYKGFPVAGKVNQLPVIGQPWIFGLKMDKPGQWSGGNIIDPNDGNMYQCKIIFHKEDGSKYKVDTLEMRGELFLGIGRSQFWQKATRQQASSLR
ncbi:MAG: DUF2147 domain-containing protein [Spirochaetaceae bacterium]|jgi:uncharacterized protein (DUF2147 family)|nr:DUF2147 domain-containing protein [Spirochaetaceae bacterium]